MENKLDIEIKPEQYFLLRNGRLIRGISELADILKTIDNETFVHHVNESRNDFSTWIRDVFNEPLLADRISGLKSREEILREIEPSTKESIESDTTKDSKIPEVEQEARLIVPNPQKQKRLPQKKSNIKNPNTVQKITPSNTLYQEMRDDLNKIIRNELNGKIEEILTREREIEIREEKIEAIENKIEKELTREKKKLFFSWDFIQGMVIGALLTMIIMLIYQKFYLF